VILPATSFQRKYLNQPKGGCSKNKEILRYMEFFNRTNVPSVKLQNKKERRKFGEIKKKTAGDNFKHDNGYEHGFLFSRAGKSGCPR